MFRLLSVNSHSVILIFLFYFTVAVASKKHSSKTTYFDLSYSINNDTIYYPGQKVDFELSKDTRGYTKSGFWYATYSFCMGEHGGTHVDSPFHFNHEGWTLDEIPPTHLIDVPATVIDIEHNVFSSESPDQYVLQVEDIIQHESAHGEIPFKSVVLLHTGWGKYWPDKVKYLGLENSSSLTEGTGIPRLSFPGCSEAAAKWLSNERGIIGFGIDTPSVDIGDNHGSLPVHILFGGRQIYNIENVANLHLIVQVMKNPTEKCNLHLFVLPLKITGGTGGPTRILAYCKN